MLLHAPWAGARSIEGARVLDAFAGTGALGLEALSRGAAHATFLEHDRAALAALRANIAAPARPRTARGSSRRDALAPSPARTAACTLVFLDPPYGRDLRAARAQRAARRGLDRAGRADRRRKSRAESRHPHRPLAERTTAPHASRSGAGHKSHEICSRSRRQDVWDDGEHGASRRSGSTIGTSTSSCRGCWMPAWSAPGTGRKQPTRGPRRLPETVPAESGVEA